MWRVTAVAVMLLAAGPVQAQADTFMVEAQLGALQNDTARLSVALGVPDGYLLYADQFEVRAQEGIRFTPVEIPDPKEKPDPFTGLAASVYDHDVVLRYDVSGLDGGALALEVNYQGCSDSVCFLPQTMTFALNPDGKGGPSLPPQESTGAAPLRASWQEPASAFAVAARASGYLKPDKFLAFLDRAETGSGAQESSLRTILERSGLLVVILLILGGGLALNLTPCVLPMIPVNIAIIGAGVESGSRARGFGLGSAYGAGIATVYGILGLTVVTTSARFGSVNASPWFNAGVALLFLVLSLSMFGAFHIDFTRYQDGINTRRFRRGTLLTALVLGGVSALLAGACVAPVVIGVLLFSSDLYAAGNRAGLLLPFLLGVGMALPWPFAGAGLSFLPKPGLWMNRIKMVFGIVILLTAIWYGRLAATLWIERMPASRDEVLAVRESGVEEGQWLTDLETALVRGRDEGRPVLVDLWASWCKNCIKMDKTTFRDEEVSERLRGYVRVKVQAESDHDPAVRTVLDHYEVVGLPTYLVLQPKN